MIELLSFPLRGFGLFRAKYNLKEIVFVKTRQLSYNINANFGASMAPFSMQLAYLLELGYPTKHSDGILT
jgi:hypothetical protein